MKSKQIKNIGYVIFIKGLTMLAPLIIIPLIIGKLGVKNYGLYIYSQSILSYFLVVITYGFELTGTREVASNKSREADNGSFNQIIWTKFILCMLCLAVLLLLVVIIPKLRDMLWLLFAGYLYNLADVFVPTWFFIGKQNMKTFAIVNVINKIFFVMLIALFLKSSSSVSEVAFFNGLSYFLVALLAHYTAFKKYKVRLDFSHFSFTKIKNQLLLGKEVFFSKFGLNITGSTLNLMIESFCGLRILGLYNLADKIISIFLVAIGSINEALFPHFTEVYQSSRIEFKKLTYKIAVIIILAGMSGILFIYFFSSTILQFLNISTNDIEYTMRIIGIIGLVIILNPMNWLFTNLFIVQNQMKSYFFIILSSMLLSLLLGFLSLKYFNFIWFVWSIVLAQAFQLTLFIIIYVRNSSYRLKESN